MKWIILNQTSNTGMPLVEQGLLTLSDHVSSPTVVVGFVSLVFLVFCVVFCRSLFVHLSFFCWPWRFLSFFDLRIWIASLVSSNSLIEGCCLQWSYWANGFWWLSWCHHFKSFTVATKNRLTEYLICHQWPRIGFICGNHNLVLSLFMTYRLISKKSNTVGATSGASSVAPLHFVMPVLVKLLVFMSCNHMS